MWQVISIVLWGVTVGVRTPSGVAAAVRNDG